MGFLLGEYVWFCNVEFLKQERFIMTDQKKEEPSIVKPADWTYEGHIADLGRIIHDLSTQLSRSEAEKNRMISKANDFVDNCEAEGLAQPGVILAMRGLIDYLTND